MRQTHRYRSATGVATFATTGWIVFALGGGGAAGACPSAETADVMRDPVVQAALDDAWRDSHEGFPDEHEEGGFVFQCHGGPSGYETRIQRWPPGTVDHGAVQRGPEPPEGCRAVASFHTHPGGVGRSGDDGYDNEHPSDDDDAFAARYGLPGIVRWGEGGDPAATSTFGYGPSSPRIPSWRCPEPPVGSSSGDPHFRTFDGVRYDAQVTGDFVLVESTDAALAVQVRLETVPTTRLGAHPLSQARAFAVRLGGTVIEMGADGLVVDGAPTAFADLDAVSPPDGGSIAIDELGAVRFTWPDGTVLVAAGPTSLTMRLADERRGGVHGLLGDGDGDATDDLRTDEGIDAAAGGSLHDDVLAGAWADAHRVAPDGSMFSGPPPAAATGAGAPGRLGLLADDVRAAATRVCAAAGVTVRDLLLECVLDVGATGEARFAADAAATERAFLELAGSGESDEDVQLLAAASNGDVELVARLLTDDDADPDARRAGDAATPLMIAAQLGATTMVEELVDAGADVGARDSTGTTALSFASANGHEPAVSMLLRAGADPQADTATAWTPLHAAALNGHDDVIELLLDAGADLDAVDDRGLTPLIAAAQVGHTDTVAVLLDADASVDAATITGWTSLHWAAVNAHADTVELLLDRGGDVDLPARDGTTPLHAAASSGDVDVVRALLEAGADTTVTDGAGNLAVDIARRSGFDDVVEVLS